MFKASKTTTERKNMKTVKSTAALLLVLSIMSYAQTKNWELDKSHSNVMFTVDYMVISEVTGKFNQFDAKVTSNGDDFSNGNIDFTIDVNSIDTDNDRRDGHLKSDDFFNAEKYPQITFKGKSLNKVSDNKYKLTGDLTMRDNTKQVELDVLYGGVIKDRNGNTRSGFKITGTINRFDYGLKWNNVVETGGAVVGKDVDITCNIQLKQVKEPES